jgi:DNA-binding transcriptional regulator YiaG
MTEQKKTALTKLEKKTIKDFRETGIMSEEEWARVQGMTYSELRRSSNIGSFLDEWEKK